MPYAILRRVAPSRRHELTLEMLNRALFGWTREEYMALRDEALTLFADRLDTFEPLWAHEPGVPEHLRVLPDNGDPRLYVLGDAGMAECLAQETAHGAVMAGRDAWLETHLLDERAAEWTN